MIDLLWENQNRGFQKWTNKNMFQIPKPEIYDNYREFPQLKAHEERLAKLKLRDPWIKYF